MGESFSVSSYASGEELLEKMDPDTQILLLDIRMKELSGMEVARKIREVNGDICIIFITTMGQCALEGYDVHAYGFLVKPLQYEVFFRQIADAMKLLEQHTGNKLVLRRQDQMFLYNVRDIVYFEVYGHSLRVVTPEESQEFITPLKEVEQQLSKQGFLRCHKSYLVNCRHVKKIEGNTLVMSNGARIALSKHRKGEFLIQFQEHMMELGWLG